MFPWIRRILTVAAFVSVASMSVPAYSLADGNVPSRSSHVESTDASVQSGSNDDESTEALSEIRRNLQDPYEQAALRLMIHGLLDGRLLPNGKLTVRLKAPMTGGDALDLLTRAVGRNEMARRLGLHVPEGITQEEWLKAALLAAEGRMSSWGDAIRPHRGEAGLHRPISGVESVALLMMAFGVQPREGRAWPDNVLTAARAAGVISEADVSLVTYDKVPRGYVFVFANNAFSSVKLASGKTVYQKNGDSSTLKLDPYPSETVQETVTLTGTVAIPTKLVFKVGTYTQTLTANGNWSVNLPLTIGANLIEIHGTVIGGTAFVQDPPVIITRVAH